MSYTNHNILPRALSYEEKENRKKGIYDSFANYLVYCPKCKYVVKTNMYIQRAEAYIDELHEHSTVCPKCGDNEWTLGYPLGTLTGFVKFSEVIINPIPRYHMISGDFCALAGNRCKADESRSAKWNKYKTSHRTDVCLDR